MTSHSSRVGSLSWNSYILSSGSRTGHIHHHDVRVAEHHVATLTGHTQEVCGLKWSLDGRYLASGGNDNLVNIWPSVQGDSGDFTPVQTFTQHQGAVKAVAWCPWQSNVLATGGGTSDRHIRIWNVCSGTCLSAVDAHSQVRHKHPRDKFFLAHMMVPGPWERSGSQQGLILADEYQHK